MVLYVMYFMNMMAEAGYAYGYHFTCSHPKS